MMFRRSVCAVAALFAVAFSLAQPAFGDELAGDAGWGPCSSTGTSPAGYGCPSTLPAINNGAIKGTDNNWNVFIGGGLIVNQGAEVEGKVFVRSTLDLNTGGNYNVGSVGAGSRIIPENGQNFLTVGGNIFAGTGSILVGGATGDVAYPVATGNLLYKGSLSGSVIVSGTSTQDAALDIDGLYRYVFTQLSVTHACLAGQPQSTNAVVEFNGYEVNLRSTNGATGTYVFNIDRDIDDNGGGQTTLNFINIPTTSTVIINLTKTGTLAVRLNNVVDNNGGAGLTFDPGFRSRILWNITDGAATTVNLAGSAQFEGSLISTHPSSPVTMAYPGFNGRFFVHGSVTQDSAGSEFHNYPFNGTLPPSCKDVQPLALRAETGSGLYKEFISWLAWDQEFGTIPEGSSKTWPITLPGTATTLDVTCDFSNFGVNSQIYAYRPGDWTGDRLDDLYNIGGTASANTLVSAISGRARTGVTSVTDTFRVSCSSQLSDGRPYAISGLVIADAEASGSTEYSSVTSDGQPWQIVESLIGTGGNANYEVRANGTDKNLSFGYQAPGALVAFSRGASTLDIELFAVGTTAVAIGVGVPLDTSDAPSGYGNAVHLFEPVGAGGTLPSIDTDHYLFAGNTAGKTPITPVVVSADSPVGVIGTLIDTNAAVTAGASATDDDTNRFPDEDAFSKDGSGFAVLPTALSVVLAGNSYALTFNCKPNGQTVAGWIDFDRNSAFAADERASGTCSGGTATLTWTVTSDISSGTSYLRLRTAQDASEISSPSGLARSGEVEDYRISIDSVPNSDVSVTLTDGVTSYVPGNTLTYTLVLGNAGPQNASATTVSMSAPSGTSITSWTCTASGGVTCPAASGSGAISQTHPSLASGGSATYTVAVAVSAVRTGNLVATATVSTTAADSNTANNTATDTDTQGVVPTPDFSIALTDGGTSYSPGGSTTYTVTVTNGGAVSGSATVAMSAPGSASISSWTCTASAGASCPATSGTGALSQTFASFPVGGTATYTVVIAIPVSQTGNLTATATVTGASDTNSANNSASDTNSQGTVLAPDFLVTINDGRTSYTPGGSQSYTMTLLNSGTASGNVNFDFPAPGLTTITSWSCAATGGASCPALTGAGAISAALTAVPVGGGLTYVAFVSVPLSQTGNLVATVTATAPVDLNTSNNTRSDTDTQGAIPAPNFAVTLTDGVSSYTPGGTLTYTLTVTNGGTSAGDGSLVFNAPGSSSIAGWTCSAAGGASCPAANGSGNLSASLSAVPIGGALTYTANVDVPITQTGNLTASATVTSAADSNTSNNTATDSDSQGAGVVYNLTISLTDSVSEYLPGGTQTYRLTVRNDGAGAAPNATISFPTPASTIIALWTCTATGASCPEASDAGPLNAVFGPLAAGAVVEYVIQVNVPAVRIGDLVANASVGTTGNESNGSDNTAADTDSQGGLSVANVYVTLTDGDDVYIAGTSTNYTMVVGNDGSAAASLVQIDMPAPADTSITAWTCSAAGGAACPLGAGVGDISGLAPTVPSGGSLTYQVTVAISPTKTGNLVAIAEAQSSGTESDTGDNQASDTNLAGSGLDMAIAVTDGLRTYRPGISREYVATVSNVGLIDVPVTTFELVSPGSSTISAWTCTATGGALCPAPSGTATSGAINNIPVGGALQFRAMLTISGSATGLQSVIVRLTTPGDVNSVNDQASDVNKPEVGIQITDDGSGGDGRYSLGEAVALQIRGVADGLVIGQVVTITLTDSVGTVITGTAVVDADYHYQLAATDISMLAPGLITVTAEVLDTDGEGPATATSSALFVFDSDEDGIPDHLEPVGDCDADGVVNLLDRDSDNDGLPDALEAGTSHSDVDSDGIDDYFDVDTTGGTDADGDGIDDARLPRDTDSDTVADICDVDSDGDRLPDRLEGQAAAAGFDADDDSDGIENRFDVDSTGGTDADGDGVDDNVLVINVDSDALPDYRDLDTDQDGITDRTESGAFAVDGDNDGVDDAFDDFPLGGSDLNHDKVADGSVARDTDSDGVADFRDLDADNDSLPDVDEAGQPDLNRDGLVDAPTLPIDNPPDSDGDGLADFRDRDRDGDGQPDILDGEDPALDGDGDGEIDDTTDTDGDGSPDVSDGDPDTFGLGRDTDGDEVIDGEDPDKDGDCLSDIDELSRDTDADGVPDLLDPDSDNDGISDRKEGNAPMATALDDDDGDGIDNGCDVDETGGLDVNADGFDDDRGGVDTDSDGDIDARDLDSDDDTLIDNVEAATRPAVGSDTDGDGVDNAFDADLVTGDTDADGISDSIVPIPDLDADGVANFRDLDSDADGIPDASEAGDFNGDGILDAYQPPRPLQASLKGAGAVPLGGLVALAALALLARRRRVAAAMLVALFITLPAPSDASETCRQRLVEQDGKSGREWDPCWQLGVTLGLSTLEPDENASGWQVVESNDMSVGAVLDYQFAENWFAEFSYTDLGVAGIRNRNPAIGGDETISYAAPALWLGYWGMEAKSEWNWYVKAGVGAIDNTASSAAVYWQQLETAQIVLGAGLQYRIAEHWFVRAGLDGFDADASQIFVGVFGSWGSHDHEDEPVAVVAKAEPVPEPAPIPEPIPAPVPPVSAAMPTAKIEAAPPAEIFSDQEICSILSGELANVEFENNSSVLTGPAKTELDRVAQLMLQYPASVTIHAHTDDKASVEYNLWLSGRRAQSVKVYLMRKGVPADRLTTVGHGESQPIASNGSEEGMQRNRRVELSSDAEICVKPAR